jgi:hypothetical protein
MRKLANITLGADMHLDKFLWRRTIATIAWAMTGAGLMTSAAFADGASNLTSKLVGTWQLSQFFDTDASGKVVYPFGAKPIGCLMYDAKGHMSVQIMRTPATKTFASGDDEKGSDAEVRAAYEGFVAYFGTYRLDEAKNVITHFVEGSSRPSYVGTVQRRPFKLQDDVLIIQDHKEDGSSYFREFHRIK